MRPGSLQVEFDVIPAFDCKGRVIFVSGGVGYPEFELFGVDLGELFIGVDGSQRSHFPSDRAQHVAVGQVYIATILIVEVFQKLLSFSL